MLHTQLCVEYSGSKVQLCVLSGCLRGISSTVPLHLLFVTPGLPSSALTIAVAMGDAFGTIVVVTQQNWDG